MDREPNTQYVASISYGKDSLAMLEAITQLGYPLDRIVHVETWATEEIPADMPDMIEFKAKADEIIFERYGVRVERICNMDKGKKVTYENIFYSKRKKSNAILGFPIRNGAWCVSKLKTDAIEATTQKIENEARTISYIGICPDEGKRVKRNQRANVILPLVDIGWSEDYCRKWCEDNDLLSPIYTDYDRGGCWFCHNQGVDSLRKLRNEHPDYWNILLKWDADSPGTFRADKHTVHDFEKRFEWEETVGKYTGKPFHWKYINTITKDDVPSFIKKITRKDTAATVDEMDAIMNEYSTHCDNTECESCKYSSTTNKCLSNYLMEVVGEEWGITE